MTHVITQNCCNDASCVPVCPVNCIHPTPDEPDYLTAEMLYIDPDGCIDCGACIDACPVSAIAPDYELPDEFACYEEINAAYFADPGRRSYEPTMARNTGRSYADIPTWATQHALRVAIVGTGPAATYAAEELLGQRAVPVKVDMFERLLTPGGLIRFGVAPDHQNTKGVESQFSRTMRRPGLRLFLGIEVGREVTHDELTTSYDAVIYAHGAMGERSLGVPGEDLPGSHSATEFVAWYNGHPDHAQHSFDLSSGERAVIIGNGNVALDIARILVADPAVLAKTDIADHALRALTASRIREVVIVGRRGPAHAAFSLAELHGLTAPHDGEAIVVAVDRDASGGSYETHASALAGLKAAAIADLPDVAGFVDTGLTDRRVVLRFLASPVGVLGSERVEGIRLSRNELVDEGHGPVARATDETFDLRTGLVLRSVGYRGRELEGLPFDETRGVVPNMDGRVVDGDGNTLPGVYVAGWIKRGPTGVIGTNKRDARLTVDALFADLQAGRLPQRDPAAAIDPATRSTAHVDAEGWRRIDLHERAQGKAERRPRVKLVESAELLAIARGETVRAGE